MKLYTTMTLLIALNKTPDAINILKSHACILNVANWKAI